MNFSLTTAGDEFPPFKEGETGDTPLMLVSVHEDSEGIGAPYCDGSVCHARPNQGLVSA